MPHFHIDLSECSRRIEAKHIKLTEYWHCCGLVRQPPTHWLVCAQPLFLSVNTPLDHSASNSSSSSSSHGPDLAKRQYLGRTPACYHNDIHMHKEWAVKEQRKCKNLPPWNSSLPACYMLFFTPFSDRDVTLISSPANDQPRAPIGLI